MTREDLIKALREYAEMAEAWRPAVASDLKAATKMLEADGEVRAELIEALKVCEKQLIQEHWAAASEPFNTYSPLYPAIECARAAIAFAKAKEPPQ